MVFCSENNLMKKLISTFALLAVASLFSASALAQSPSVNFKILAPTDNQTLYGNKIPILFSVENFTLIDAQKPLAGQGYILVWLDDETRTADSATKLTADTFTFSDVSYGNHNLNAELVTSDNKALNPPQKIDINFKTAELPSSTPPEATTFDKKTTAVILIIVALVIIAAWWYTKDEEIEEPAKPSSPVKRKTAKKRRK